MPIRERDDLGRVKAKLHFSREFLRREYELYGKSAAVIAGESGCADTSVRYWLKRFGIKLKPVGAHLIGKGQRLTGRRIGRLQVKEKVSKDAWMTLCDCGRQYRASGFMLRNKRVLQCRDCSCPKLGHGPVQQAAWQGIVRGALKRKLPVTVSIAYLAELFEKQDRRCALSGVPIEFALTRRAHVEERKSTASLDRIDSKKPYEHGNVQWVHKIVNIMKGDLSDEDFISWCRKIGGRMSS